MKDDLFICGKCGMDTSEIDRCMQTKKVIRSGFANLLCGYCRCELDDALAAVAKEYLLVKKFTKL